MQSSVPLYTAMSLALTAVNSSSVSASFSVLVCDSMR